MRNAVLAHEDGLHRALEKVAAWGVGAVGGEKMTVVKTLDLLIQKQ